MHASNDFCFWDFAFGFRLWSQIMRENVICVLASGILTINKKTERLKSNKTSCLARGPSDEAPPHLFAIL